MITFYMTEHPETLEKRAAALKYLASHRVDVGLPSSAPERSQFILAIQEHGSPVMRIPPRPVITPALSQAETREAMTAAMMEALEAAHDGNLAEAQAELEACGHAGAGDENYQADEADEVSDGSLFRRFDEVHRQRGYTPDQLRAAAERAGLVWIDMQDVTTGGPVDDNTERAMAAVRREK